MSDLEHWAAVSGYEGLYEVSSLGRVKSVARQISRSDNKPFTLKERILKPFCSRKKRTPRHYVHLCRECVCLKKPVHVLVCETFHGPRPEGYFACHDDGDPFNNSAANLKWGTPSENNADMVRHGRSTIGLRSWRASLDDHAVREIRSQRRIVKSSELAERYGVRKGVIHHIWCGNTYKDVA